MISDENTTVDVDVDASDNSSQAIGEGITDEGSNYSILVETNSQSKSHFMRLGDTESDITAVTGAAFPSGAHPGIVMQSNEYLNNIVNQNYNLTTYDYKSQIKGKRKTFINGSDTREASGNITRTIKNNVATTSKSRSVVADEHIIDVAGDYFQKSEDTCTFSYQSFWRNCASFDGNTKHSVDFFLGSVTSISKGTGSSTSFALNFSINLGFAGPAGLVDVVRDRDTAINISGAASIMQYGANIFFQTDTENKYYLGAGLNKFEFKLGLFYKNADKKKEDKLVCQESASISMMLSLFNNAKSQEVLQMCAAAIHSCAKDDTRAETRNTGSVVEVQT